jgi:radical SAM superfamily enzyme YgiQ (UPF0313 family)
MYMTKTLCAVQPRHIYAPPYKQGMGHVYTPTSLWTVMAKLMQSEADIRIVLGDENLRPVDTDHYDIVAANLVGLPYVPVVRERFRSIMEGNGQQLILGGRVVEGLTTRMKNGHPVYDPRDFVRFFGPHTIDGNVYKVGNTLGIPLEKLIIQDTDVSLKPIYEHIPDEDMREYLHPEREISFFLSRGCAQNCDFCGAQRKESETYRSMRVIEDDLTYLTERAQKLGLQKLNMYLSNLDVFQTPEQLGEFASIITALKRKYPGFTYHMHGLAITTSLTNTRRKFKHVLRSIVDAGLHTVGLGVDGGDNATRRMQHKGFVTDENIWEAMEACREYGMTPESIMVFGGQRETRESIENGVRLIAGLKEQFGAVPRPHVFKDMIPGNIYWSGEKDAPHAKERQETMFRNPWYCQAQDFKSRASSLSHPVEELRTMVNSGCERIAAMCDDPRDCNSMTFPYAPEFSEMEVAQYKNRNMYRYDR